VQVVGEFAGYDEVTVMAEVSGRVVKILPNRDVGDVVRPGDVLLKIDPTDYQLAISETRRALELEATRIGAPIPPDELFIPEKILATLKEVDIERFPPVQRAQEQERNAKLKRDRAKPLRDARTISQEAFEQVETDYEVARRSREQTELDAKAVLAGIKHRLVQLQVAELKLKRTDLVVPTPTQRDGMPKVVEYSIAQRKVTEGEMVKDSAGASMVAYELVMDTVLKLVGNVPERYVRDVDVGQTVDVWTEAYPGRVFSGRVSRISPAVDRASRTFKVEVLVPNPKRELRPGGFARAEIRPKEDPMGWTVPRSAIATFVGSRRVFIIRDGKAVAVPVTPGIEVQNGAESWAELVDPPRALLEPRVALIVGGITQVEEGVPVTLRPATASKDGKATAPSAAATQPSGSKPPAKSASQKP
jgi:multidrug efflux pump subunit AcrA (membrane-fusion protein)